MPVHSDRVRAIEENLWAMWSQFGLGPGCRLHETDGMLWFETPIPVPPYNMVIRTHADDDPAAPIDRIFAHFRGRQVPFVWFVHPTARPLDLRTHLETRGFRDVERVAGMAANLDALPDVPPAPDGIQVAAIAPDSATPYLEFVAARWHVPDETRPHLLAIAGAFRIGARGSRNRAWVAVKDGVVIAKVFTHDGNGHVGVYGMATRPEWRGMGLGRLVCLAALSDARQRGHTLAVLHATPAARRLYESLGFREHAAFNLYAEPGTFYA